MYKINHQNNILEILNTKNNSIGKIHLDLGASLQELTLVNTKIIADLAPLPYNKTFASSILFPFANRVKDGKYSFEDKDYSLKTNQEEEKNALHGFIFNSTFSIKRTETTNSKAVIELEYHEKNGQIGFPFRYSFLVTYIFTEKNLTIDIKVKNTDDKTFPFTIGWHPYFTSEDLNNSNIEFNCSDKMKLDKRNITIGKEDINTKTTIDLYEKKLDDCWSLQDNAVKFKTPSYELNFKSSSKDNFLQLYTPPKQNVIAIEPTTGVSDSFNNKIGLQTLAPNQTYSINWTLSINKVST